MAEINLLGSIGLPGSSAILGAISIAMTTADHTMLASEYSNNFIELTGAIGANRNLIGPTTQGQEFVIQNNTSGGYSVTIKTVSGTGITIANGSISLVSCDGINYLAPSGGSTAPSGSAGGNLSGTYPNPTVVKINGNSVYADILNSTDDGYVLTWDNVDGYWRAKSAAISFTAGGDLSGSNTNQTVKAIQGNTVTSGALTEGQFLVASSTSNWAATTLSGDVSESASTPGKLTIMGIQGNPISGTPATAGQFLIENAGATGSAWTSLSGDVTDSISTAGALTVTGLQGNPVESGILSSVDDGYLLAWNNSSTQWQPKSPSLIISAPSASIGTYANIPAAGTAGRMYFATDSANQMWVDNGSFWQPFISGQVLGITPPAASLWSAFNASGASPAPTLTQQGGGLFYTGSNDGANNITRGFTISDNGYGMFIEAAIEPIPPGSENSSYFTACGIGLRETSSAKMIGFFITVNHSAVSWFIEAMGFSSNTVRNNDFGYTFPFGTNGPIFLRIRRGGSAGGSYSVAPSVSFSGGGGSGATGTCSIGAGNVVVVTITNGGSGYTSAPTVSFSGGTGSGASATATVYNRQILWVTNGTSIYAEFSRDRITWQTPWTIGTTTVFTTAPDTACIVSLGYNIQPSFNITHLAYG